MWQALRSTIIELLDSKKFALVILAMIAQLAARYGMHFTAEQAWLFISPAFAGIAGQAHVDASEAKAKGVAAAGSPSNVQVVTPGPAAAEDLLGPR